MPKLRSPRTRRRLVVLAVGVSAAAVVVAAFLLIRGHLEAARAEAVESWRTRLESAMEGRVAGVASWADARLRDAHLVANYPALRALLVVACLDPRGRRATRAGAAAGTHPLPAVPRRLRSRWERHRGGPGGRGRRDARGAGGRRATPQGTQGDDRRSRRCRGPLVFRSHCPAHRDGRGRRPPHVVGSYRPRRTAAWRDCVRGRPVGLPFPAPGAGSRRVPHRGNAAPRPPARRRLHRQGLQGREAARGWPAFARFQVAGRTGLCPGPGVLGGRGWARRSRPGHDAPGTRHDLGPAREDEPRRGRVARRSASLAGRRDRRRHPPRRRWGRPSGCGVTARPPTCGNGCSSRSSCGNRRRWRRSVGWPAGWRTTSTTC